MLIRTTESVVSAARRPVGLHRLALGPRQRHRQRRPAQAAQGPRAGRCAGQAAVPQEGGEEAGGGQEGGEEGSTAGTPPSKKSREGFAKTDALQIPEKPERPHHPKPAPPPVPGEKPAHLLQSLSDEALKKKEDEKKDESEEKKKRDLGLSDADDGELQTQLAQVKQMFHAVRRSANPGSPDLEAR